MKTIWSRDAIPPEDARIEKLLTRVLPTVDVILIAFGVFVILYGAPIFAAALFESVALVFGVIVTITATLALIGLIFLRSRLELVSKIVLMAVLSLYPFLLLTTLTPARAAVGALCLIAVPVLLWRIGDIGWEKGKQT